MIAALIAASTAKLAAAGATAATAAPTLATTAATVAPTLATTAGTTAANLGTTAALEASKQGIVQAGAQQAGLEAAKSAGVEVAKQAGTEAATNVAIDQAVQNGLNNVNNLSASLNQPGGIKTLSDAGSLQGGTPNIIQQPSGPSLEQLANNMPPVNTPVTPSGAEQNLINQINNAPINPYTQANVQLDPQVFNAGDAMQGVKTVESGSTGLQKGFESALNFAKENPLATAAGIQVVGRLVDSGGSGGPPQRKPATRKDMSGFESSEPSTVAYNPIYQPTAYAANGGLMGYAVGGTVEQMSAQNAISGNTMYPQSQLQTPMYSNPMMQRPMPTNVINSGIDAPVAQYTGEPRFAAGGATGSGSLDLHVPIDLGASGIAQGGAGGYSAGDGQTSTLSTATGAPSQTAQPPVAMAPAATAEPLNIQPRGNSYVPTVQWGETPGVMAGLGRPTYTVGDSAADSYVKNNAGSNLNLHDPQTKAKIEELYKKYYQGYAKGGTTKSQPNYSEMMGIRSAEQQKADEEYLQAFNKKEMAGSIHTDSDIETARQDPMHASMTRLKKIGKRVGIKPVEMPKSGITDSNVFHAAANGGIMHNLGGYSDGGRLLKGPGDGVSDSIPATIGNRQPARLADGEFVVPARIVSELGNGSTEAGARKLYQMMERVQADRKKSIGKGKVAVNSKATKHLPK